MKYPAHLVTVGNTKSAEYLAEGSPDSGGPVLLMISMRDRLELASLYDWLRNSATVAETSRVSLASSGRTPGEQGALDVINVVLSNAIAIGSLAVSIANWRLARRQEAEMTLAQGGRRISTNATDAEAIEKVIGELASGPDTKD